MQSKIFEFLFFLSILLFMTVAFLVRVLIAAKKKNTELKKKVEQQNENSKNMSEYVKNLSDINSRKDELSSKLKDAESDEDVKNIIDSIVSANNNRVRKPAKD